MNHTTKHKHAKPLLKSSTGFQSWKESFSRLSLLCLLFLWCCPTTTHISLPINLHPISYSPFWFSGQNSFLCNMGAQELQSPVALLSVTGKLWHVHLQMSFTLLWFCNCHYGYLNKGPGTDASELRLEYWKGGSFCCWFLYWVLDWNLNRNWTSLFMLELAVTSKSEWSELVLLELGSGCCWPLWAEWGVLSTLTLVIPVSDG